MKRLVFYEFRKMLNQVSILAIAALVIISTVYTLMLYLDPKTMIINSNGEVVRGIKSYGELKKEAKDIEGIIDQNYLDNLIKKYNSSEEKKIYDKGPTPKSKYMISNIPINFTYFAENLMPFDVDLDHVESEKEFYNERKKTLSNSIKGMNEYNGLFKYTGKQRDVIKGKIDNIKTPFKVEYGEGLANFISGYGKQYWLVFIAIGFALSSIFSRDSNNGIDELSLSSTFGRKKNMNARVIAGNIFAVVAYIIFVGTLLIEHGLVASLHGWGQSVQMYWYTCMYNISLGTGILIMLGFGLLGVLVVANLIMLLSIKAKNSKIATGLAIASVWVLMKLTETANPLQLQLNPIFFSTRLATTKGGNYEIYHFIGNTAIPYSLIILLLTFIYILIITFFTVKSYKKYRLN